MLNEGAVAQNTEIFNGILSNNAVANTITVRHNGFLMNHLDRVVQNVTVEEGGHVGNPGGTVLSLVMTGGTFHNLFDVAGAAADYGTVGAGADIKGTAWMYNSMGGQMLGTVNVSENAILEHANNRHRTDRIGCWM